jgi:ketosteroid isomerase-like protein
VFGVASNERPNTRVQRTRSSPSAPHSPLTRRPLGTGSHALLWRRRAIQVAVTAILFAGCATQKPAKPDGASQVLGAFVSALNHADIDAVTGLLAANATAFLPLESCPSELVGREAIRSALLPVFLELRQQSSGPEYMHLVPKDVHIQSVGSVAIVTFDSGSGPAISRRSLVIEKSSRGWLIMHFHGSNIRKQTAGAGA